MASSRFADKVAIVTGGCSGIGRGIADLLVEHGGKVAILDINDELGKQITDENYFFVHCDVSNTDQVVKAVETVISQFGKLDLLVNNAALQPIGKTIDEIEAEEFLNALNVNTVGYFRMCKFCLPHLRKTKGSIVNIASIVSDTGVKGAAYYVTSKGGIVAMTRALAIDESAISEVRINSISPGGINTPLLQTFYNEEQQAKMSKMNLMNRLGTVREVAMACLYLAVDATYNTGSTLYCTGGYEIGIDHKMM